MLDVTIIFKIGAMVVILVFLAKVLKASGKDEIATIANIVGIVIILITVIGLIGNLFNTVKTMFML